MATQLTLLCCSATASARASAFPHRDEPLDDGGRDKARRRTIAPPPEQVLRSPARAADETATAMGLQATVEERLADIGVGAWAGCTLVELHARAPDALHAWIARPENGAPSGETLGQVRRRLRPWLDAIAAADRRVLAITHATVIRAVLAEALDLPDRAAMRFDIAPLSALRLSYNREWRAQELRGG